MSKWKEGIIENKNYSLYEYTQKTIFDPDLNSQNSPFGPPKKPLSGLDSYFFETQLHNQLVYAKQNNHSNICR